MLSVKNQITSCTSTDFRNINGDLHLSLIQYLLTVGKRINGVSIRHSIENGKDTAFMTKFPESQKGKAPALTALFPLIRSASASYNYPQAQHLCDLVLLRN